MLAELADYIRGAHDPGLAEKEGMVYMVWQDFRITLQKSGGLLWQRNMHTVYPGVCDVLYEMPEPYRYFPGESYAYISDDAADYVLQILKAGPQLLLSPEQLLQEYQLTAHTEGAKSIIHIPAEQRGRQFPPYVKGLIFNKAGVVCPGVIIPEDITTEQEFTYEAVGQVQSLEPALDGVLFRVYYDAETDRWAASTNGQIQATKGWGGRAFAELFADPVVQQGIDYTVLNRAYCYYVVLEHPEYINIVPHFKARAILVDVVTLAQPFRAINPLSVEGFTTVQIRQPAAGYTPQSLFSLAEQYKVGVLVHLTSGRRVRIEATMFKHMSRLRPNIADVYKQWIHKVCRPSLRDGTIAEIITASEQDIIEYLKYFTWHTEKFNFMRQRFHDLYTAMCIKLYEPKYSIPKRAVKFFRALTASERTPEGILCKLIDAEEKHLFYLMNPWNMLDPQVERNSYV